MVKMVSSSFVPLRYNAKEIEFKKGMLAESEKRVKAVNQWIDKKNWENVRSGLDSQVYNMRGTMRGARADDARVFAPAPVRARGAALLLRLPFFQNSFDSSSRSARHLAPPCTGPPRPSRTRSRPTRRSRRAVPRARRRRGPADASAALR